uniref:Transmembrane protein 150B n=1 Tax=Ovis aries TaxID=9940 RepID=A0AC11CWR5_SHEEP
TSPTASPTSVCVETCPPRAASSARCSTSEPLRVNALRTFPAVLAPPSQDRRCPCLLRPPPNPGVGLPPLDPRPTPKSGAPVSHPLPLLPAAWICILRYYQLRDWGVRKWHNQVILWTGLLCALGTSIVGNFQEKNQRSTHLTGAFLAFFVGILYFWLQLFLSWRMKNLPQPGAPWIGPLRLVLCSACFVLEVAMVVLHSWSMRSVSAICEWVVAMLLFILFGLLAVDFSRLDGCTLCLQPDSGSLRPPPDSPTSLHVQL